MAHDVIAEADKAALANVLLRRKCRLFIGAVSSVHITPKKAGDPITHLCYALARKNPGLVKYKPGYIGLEWFGFLFLEVRVVI